MQQAKCCKRSDFTIKSLQHDLKLWEIYDVEKVVKNKLETLVKLKERPSLYKASFFQFFENGKEISVKDLK